jgi:hypothetical protein
MTLRCTVQVETGLPAGAGFIPAAAVLERPNELAPDTLGLTLAEAHALLRNVQARLVGRRSTPGKRRTAPVRRAGRLAN